MANKSQQNNRRFILVAIFILLVVLLLDSNFLVRGMDFDDGEEKTAKQYSEEFKKNLEKIKDKREKSDQEAVEELLEKIRKESKELKESGKKLDRRIDERKDRFGFVEDSIGNFLVGSVGFNLRAKFLDLIMNQTMLLSSLFDPEENVFKKYPDNITFVHVDTEAYEKSETGGLRPITDSIAWIDFKKFEGKEVRAITLCEKIPKKGGSRCWIDYPAESITVKSNKPNDIYDDEYKIGDDLKGVINEEVAHILLPYFLAGRIPKLNWNEVYIPHWLNEGIANQFQSDGIIKDHIERMKVIMKGGGSFASARQVLTKMPMGAKAVYDQGSYALGYHFVIFFVDDKKNKGLGMNLSDILDLIVAYYKFNPNHGGDFSNITAWNSAINDFLKIKGGMAEMDKKFKDWLQEKYK